MTVLTISVLITIKAMATEAVRITFDCFQNVNSINFKNSLLSIDI